MEHLSLFLLWCSFCLFHSFLASDWIKQKIKSITGIYYSYYRVSYSVFAILHLTIVLVYQFSIPDKLLWQISFLIEFIAILCGGLGIVIMLISIHKYFFNLSGIHVFAKQSASSILQRDVMHRFTRHPLYLGTLIVVWSLLVLFPYLKNLVASLTMTAYTLIGIRMEERKLLVEYGESYKKYIREVPRLSPKIYRRKKRVSP